jgi:hypothetical protein
MTITQAMEQASRELAPQRFLRSSAGYRACFDARVAELRAANWLQPTGSAETTPETAANRVGLAHLALPKETDHPNGRISG